MTDTPPTSTAATTADQVSALTADEVSAAIATATRDLQDQQARLGELEAEHQKAAAVAAILPAEAARRDVLAGQITETRQRIADLQAAISGAYDIQRGISERERLARRGADWDAAEVFADKAMLLAAQMDDALKTVGALYEATTEAAREAYRQIVPHMRGNHAAVSPPDLAPLFRLLMSRSGAPYPRQESPYHARSDLPTLAERMAGFAATIRSRRPAG